VLGRACSVCSIRSWCRTEVEIYAGTAKALGVSLDGVTLPDMRAMRRA
jgi:hypothetical protein